MVKFFINAANNGHLRGLAEELNESTNAIRKELNNLSEAGYLEKEAIQNRISYKANIKLIVGMVPINLIDDIKEVGFDYNMSPREVADRVKEGHLTLSEHQVIIPVSD